MISEKQLIANRQNALRSTGPRSAEGKAIASQNALRHGLRAEQVVILGESSDDYEQFSTELLAQFSPEGVLESRLVDQIAVTLWKLQRVERIEGDLFRHMQDTEQLRQRAAAKRIEYGAHLPAVASQHCVPFVDARDAWLKTESGKCYRDNDWPVDSRCPTPVQEFDKFWTALDLKARDRLNEQALQPAAPFDQPACEPHRTDLSYQVMLEQNQQKTAFRQNRDDASPEGGVADPLQQAAPFTEPISLSREIRNDFSGPNLMLKFSRYKMQFESSFYRALNELNKLQYLRRQRQAIEVQASEPETS
ncbi:MAG: hypothetical protein OEV87_01720 [Phycisphaerae bacterium]|nr:hypothetical protein [Phycisphaerae bacterium]